MRGSGLSGRRARFRSVPLLCVGRGTGMRRASPLRPSWQKRRLVAALMVELASRRSLLTCYDGDE